MKGLKKGKVTVVYAYVDGAHFFTSPDPIAKGLCVASEDLATAFHEVNVQLSELISDRKGRTVAVCPLTPLKAFEALIAARVDGAHLNKAAIATWSMDNRRAA